MTLQEKIDALPANGGLIRLDHDEIITEPIVIDDRTGVRIIGESYDTQIYAELEKPGPAFLCRDMRFSELANIRVVARTNCTAALLLGRSAPNKMCYHNHLHDLQLVGDCSVATLATIGAEVLHVNRVYAANEHDHAFTYMTGRTVVGNFGADVSLSNNVGNSVIALNECTFLSNGDHAATMVINGTVNWAMRGGFIRNKHGQGGRNIQRDTAGIVIKDGTNLILDGIKQEGSDTQYGVMVAGPCKRLRITGSRLHGETAFAVLSTGRIVNTVLDMTNELISQNQHTKPYRIDGENYNSRIEVGTHP